LQIDSSPIESALASGRGDAPDEIARILDRAPRLAAEVLRGDTRLTRRWSHGALHDSLPGLKGHVVMTYYGLAQQISWRQGKMRQSSQTRPGSITVIPDGHDGRWDIGGPIEVSHVYLTDDRFQTCAEALGGGLHIDLLDRVGFDDPAAARILELLSQEASHQDSASRLFVERAIDLLCIQLIRGHSSVGALTKPSPRRGLADWQVKRVTDYMRDRFDEDINLDELAALVTLSRFHFCTAFRLATGRTPHEWLTQLRMNRARELLTDPMLRITDIALAVGFETPSAFAATFRRSVGTTPSEFRRSL
jgi:AraC family transcriptional regulator